MTAMIETTKKLAFISYSRADWTKVQQLANALEDIQISAWVDFLKIKPGDKWHDIISSALASSDVMILCLSPLALDSFRVPEEVRAANENGLFIIPVVFEEFDFNLLPSELQDIQMLRFMDYPKNRAARLIAMRIAEALDYKPAILAQTEPVKHQVMIIFLGENAKSISPLTEIRSHFADDSELTTLSLCALDSPQILTLSREAGEFNEALIIVGENVKAEELGIVSGLLVGQIGADRVRILSNTAMQKTVVRIRTLTGMLDK